MLKVLASALIALLVGLSGVARADEITVFAAASLTNAFEELGEAVRRADGTPIRFSFAASSTLARQIESGAPADIFASADEQWMDYLERKQKIVPGSRVSVLGNRLVLIAPASQPSADVAIGPNFPLKALLGAGRLATGDPDHVPVGRYARDALIRLGVWNDIEPRLARADNVRVALALVERGETPFGIVYQTDAAIAPRVRIAGVFPADSHAPISYPFAIVAGHDRPAVREALAFLLGSESEAVYRKYGFSIAR